MWIVQIKSPAPNCVRFIRKKQNSPDAVPIRIDTAIRKRIFEVISFANGDPESSNDHAVDILPLPPRWGDELLLTRTIPCGFVGTTVYEQLLLSLKRADFLVTEQQF